MSKLLIPKAVRDALDRMNAGEASAEVLSVLVAAAEEYAKGAVEWGFESPQPGLMYATNNDMLIDVMSAAKPEATVYARIGLPWQPEGTNE